MKNSRMYLRKYWAAEKGKLAESMVFALQVTAVAFTGLIVLGVLAALAKRIFGM